MKSSVVSVMTLAKCFMTPPHVHSIKQVKLQKTLVTTDAVITEMTPLTHQTQKDMKAFTLEKNLTNLKTLRNHLICVPALIKFRDSPMQRKSSGRENMMTVSTPYTVFCNKESTLKRNHTSVRNVGNASVLPQASVNSRESILERSAVSATFLTNPSPHIQILKHIKDSTLERSLTNAVTVADPLPTIHLLEGITKFTL